MVIESDSITKEYAEEYLCIAAMSKKLVKECSSVNFGRTTMIYT